MRRFVPEICGVECGSREKCGQNFGVFLRPEFGGAASDQRCEPFSVQFPKLYQTSNATSHVALTHFSAVFLKYRQLFREH